MRLEATLESFRKRTVRIARFIRTSSYSRKLLEKGQEAYKEDRDDYKLRLKLYKIRKRDY
ncbi:hypothetical protein A1F97_03487 [Pyrenophora tritici-repentis]|nr:hypothetical protein A1F97_03487 [Pyrenophora tritici-repentis]